MQPLTKSENSTEIQNIMFERSESQNESNSNTKIENVLMQFAEVTQDNFQDTIITPLLMLNEILDDSDEDDKEGILIQFQNLFPLFFSILTIDFDYHDIQFLLIDLIAIITDKLNFQSYESFITAEFLSNLANLLQVNPNVIDIVTNIFSEIDSEGQILICQEILPLLELFSSNSKLQNKMIRFIYIVIQYFHDIDQQIPLIVNFFKDSLINISNPTKNFYYYSLYSIGKLIEKGLPVIDFLLPEYLSIFNECLHSTSENVIKSSFFLIHTIINQLYFDKNESFKLFELFDYDRIIQIAFNDEFEQKTRLRSLDILISSAAFNLEMQNFLNSLNLIEGIQSVFQHSPFKLQSNYCTLYLNLIPRDEIQQRIQLLSIPLFADILSDFDCFDDDVKSRIFKMIIFTLRKSNAIGCRDFHRFLVEQRFHILINEFSTDKESFNNYVSEILSEIEDDIEES